MMLCRQTPIYPLFPAPSQFNNLQWPNCIDPALFFDDEERLWMVYGSWSGGIFLLEIDKETGYPIILHLPRQ